MNNALVRIAACQNIHSLIAAVAAMKSSGVGTQPHKNYLVIFAPAATHDSLIRAASLLCAWEKIVTCTNEQLINFFKAYPEEPFNTFFEQYIAFPAADELYLYSNHHIAQNRLMRLFPHAKKIAYGDGLGIYRTFDVATPAAFRHVIAQRLKRCDLSSGATLIAQQIAVSALDFIKQDRLYRQFPWAKGRIQPYRRIDFDEGRFSHIDIAEKNRLVPCYLIPLDAIREIIERLWSLADHAELDHIAEQAQGKRVVVGLLGHFPPEDLSLERELRAYENYFRRYDPTSHFLILKPHPADSHGKIHMIKELFANKNNCSIIEKNVLVPYEVFCRREPFAAATVVAFKTAALSVHRLYDIPCTVGFGSAIVNQCFKWPKNVYRNFEERRLNRFLTSRQ